MTAVSGDTLLKLCPIIKGHVAVNGNGELMIAPQLSDIDLKGLWLFSRGTQSLD